MTTFSWVLLAAGAFSIYISYRITERMTGKKNLLLTGLISLFLLFLNTIICTFSIKYIGDNAGLIFGDKYRAVIVGFEEKDGSTSITNSRSAGRKTFYTPIVEYKDKEGNIRRKSVNTGTDRPSGTGMIITVSDSLDDDVMNDISAAKSPVVLLIFCFFSVLFSISFSVTCYGLGATNNKNIRITKKVFFICIIIGLSLYATNFIIAINT